MMLKLGRQYLDPLNRVVTLIGIDAAAKMVTVKLSGPYGATIKYPQSVIRPLLKVL